MKTFKSILLLAFFACALISCSEDDDSSDGSGNGTGSFIYDSNTFALDKGSVINYGGAGNSFNFDITLGSPSLTFNQVGNIDGSGDVIYFELWTDQQSGLKSGTYNYNSSSEADYTFTIGEVGVGCDTNGGCTFLESATSGSVTIDRSGSNYDISFTLTMSSGYIITGEYDGSLRSSSDI